MKRIPYDPKELEVIAEHPERIMGRTGMQKTFNRPVTEKENMRMLYFDKYPMWLTGRAANRLFAPQCIPDNIARAFVFDGTDFDNTTQGGGPDMFGVPWVYVPVVGGCMEDPNTPHLFEDVNDWKKVLKFPDIESWDWEGSRKDSEEYLDTDMWIMAYLFNGAWFERLISFMGFENAALALLDEDQEDAIMELFAATTDLYKRLADKMVDVFPEIDCFFMHDDWGTQRAPFFSQEIAEKFFVPFMKDFTDHVKAKGVAAELHSCGCNESRLQAFIDGGWQSWTPQPMNDSDKMYAEHGGEIILTFNLEMPKNLPEAEQRARAREFVDKYCVPNKKFRITLNTNTPEYLQSIDGRKLGGKFNVGLEAFEEELYIQSRLKYLSFLENEE